MTEKELQQQMGSVMQEKEVAEPPKKRNALSYIGAASKKDVLFFTKNLAVLIKTGSTLSDSLRVISQQAKGAWKKIILEIYQYIEKGIPLSIILARYPRIFPALYVSVVEIGEQSGTLEENLGYIGEQLEKDAELRRQVIGAMMYPALVLVGTLVVGTGVTIFVLPKLSDLFGAFGADLPFATQVLLSIAELYEKWGIWSLVAVFAALGLLFVFFRLKMTRPLTHWLYLHIPIVKRISQHVNLAQFCRTLSILLRTGITIDEALRTCARTTGNYHYQRFLMAAYEKITSGISLTEILEQKPKLFPPTDVQIIQVGEQSGTLSDSLQYCAELHEKEVRNLTQNLATTLEPIILLVLGGAVAFLALSVITPIYSITDQFRV